MAPTLSKMDPVHTFPLRLPKNNFKYYHFICNKANDVCKIATRYMASDCNYQ